MHVKRPYLNRAYINLGLCLYVQIKKSHLSKLLVVMCDNDIKTHGSVSCGPRKRGARKRE